MLAKHQHAIGIVRVAIANEATACVAERCFPASSAVVWSLIRAWPVGCQAMRYMFLAAT